MRNTFGKLSGSSVRNDGMHLSPLLVAEQDLDGSVGDEIREGPHEEWESGLEVYAIGCENYIALVRDGLWEWVTPGIEGSKKSTERVE